MVDLVAGIAGLGAGGGARGVDCGGEDGVGTGAGDAYEGVGDAEFLGAGGGCGLDCVSGRFLVWEGED